MKYLPYTIFALGFIFNTTGNLLKNYSDNRTSTIVAQIGYLLICVFFMHAVFSIYQRRQHKPILGSTLCTIGNASTLFAGLLQLMDELQPDSNGKFTDTQKAIITGVAAAQGAMILGNFFFSAKYTVPKVINEEECERLPDNTLTKMI